MRDIIYITDIVRIEILVCTVFQAIRGRTKLQGHTVEGIMKLFRFIEKHPVLSFWFSLLYMVICSHLCEECSGSKWLHAIVILPINMVTWPVSYTLFKNGKWKLLDPIDRKFVFLLPLMSVTLPLVPFIWD